MKDFQARLNLVDTARECIPPGVVRPQGSLQETASSAASVDRWKPVALLKSGAWLTLERVRGYSLVILSVFVLAIVVFISLSDGSNDFFGRPLGTDFSNVYAAGVLVHEQKTGDPYDPLKQHDTEKKLFGSETPFYGWHYPPFFLLVAGALAALPYAWALVSWLLVTFSAYLAAIYAIWPRTGVLLVASAFPAVILNAGHGQNGFLTAALLGGALASLNARPALAGVLIGLLAYKPQFGILIPLVLLATLRWRANFAAGGTVATLAAVSWFALGSDAFEGFFASTEYSRVVVLEAGATGWEKIQSIFSAFRSLGSPVGAAYAAQGALLLVLAVTLVGLWRSSADYDLKAAALAVGCLLGTPYVLDYDLVVLAVAICYFVKNGCSRGFLAYEISFLAVVFMAPLATRTIMAATGVPLGLLSLVAFYALILRRANALSGRGPDEAGPRPRVTSRLQLKRAATYAIRQS
jgi:alpha-1,2-mannosyltransferase